MAALANDLAKDRRPLRELSPEERRARIEKVMGVGRSLMSPSEEFAERKREEAELEEQKFGHNGPRPLQLLCRPASVSP